MTNSLERPLSITIAAGLIASYAAMFILWDLLSPFERPYTLGPASVILGVRVFGVWAQLMHVLQLLVAMALVYGLWTMQHWSWNLVQFIAGYMALSNLVWAGTYQDFSQVLAFSFFYFIVIGLLLALTYPHREKFV